jgi:hypothetical protein
MRYIFWFRKRNTWLKRHWGFSGWSRRGVALDSTLGWPDHFFRRTVLVISIPTMRQQKGLEYCQNISITFWPPGLNAVYALFNLIVFLTFFSGNPGLQYVLSPASNEGKIYSQLLSSHYFPEVTTMSICVCCAGNLVLRKMCSSQSSNSVSISGSAHDDFLHIWIEQWRHLSKCPFPFFHFCYLTDELSADPNHHWHRRHNNECKAGWLHYNTHCSHQGR